MRYHGEDHQKWLSGKWYKQAKGKTKSATRESSNTDSEPTPPELASVSTQTDTQVEDSLSQEQVLQEEDQDLIKLCFANNEDDPGCDSDRINAMGDSNF